MRGLQCKPTIPNTYRTLHQCPCLVHGVWSWTSVGNNWSCCIPYPGQVREAYFCFCLFCLGGMQSRCPEAQLAETPESVYILAGAN